MAVISFASLKGGVGKTSCAVNVAHALARRGCEVVLLDLDPLAQATCFFKMPQQKALDSRTMPLVQLLLSERLEWCLRRKSSVLQAAAALEIELCETVREGLQLIPGGSSLPRLSLDSNEKVTHTLFPLFIEELAERFDFVINDLAPHYSVLAEVALGASDVVVVPVDMSLMSIWGLEQLADQVSHLAKPAMAILRTMVNRQASRVRALNESRLRESLAFKAPVEPDAEDRDEGSKATAVDSFLSRVAEYEKFASGGQSHELKPTAKEKPIYLLDSVIYRTELHNRLGFMGKTAFDKPVSRELADSYLQVAREIEKLLALCGDLEEPATGSFIEKIMAGN